MTESTPFGTPPEGEPATDAGRAGYEQTLMYKRPETYAFPERLHPEAVAISASELTALFLERWYETGAVPSAYRVDDMIINARERIQQLRINMPLGITNSHYYTPSAEERIAGLVPGTFWRELPPELQNDPSITIRQSDVKGPDGQPIRYWVKNGRDVGIFGYNRAEQIAFAAIGDPDKFRPRFAIGIDVKEEGSGGAKEKREALADQIEIYLNQIEAWNNLLAKVNEQEAFADDLDNYIIKEFFRIGKVKMRAKFYAEILNAPPTKEGFAGFGEKIQAAHEAWRNIAEGRAAVELTFRDPTLKNQENVRKETAVLPNPFAYGRNQGLLDLCARYVQLRISTEKPSKIGESEDKVGIQALEKRDNKAAAIAALVLFDHWDEDAAAALDILRNPETGTIEEAIMNIAIVDSTKLVAAPLRRQTEFYGFTDLKRKDNKRPHPREAGAPFTLRTLPYLHSHMLDVATVEVLAKNLDGKTKKIRVTVDQKAAGVRGNEGKRIIRTANGRRFSQIRQAERSDRAGNGDFWEFEVTGLGDKGIWDNIGVLVGKGDQTRVFETEKIEEMALKDPSTLSEAQREQIKMRLVEGTSSFPYEVPTSLLAYYAYASLYSEFTRTDFAKQYEEYIEINYAKTRKLNKQITLAVGVLKTAHQLSDDTVEQLEEYLRISLITGCLASYIRRDDTLARVGGNIEGQPQMHPNDAVITPDQKINIMQRAILGSRFVRTKSDKTGNLSWERPGDQKLFETLLINRDKAPLSPYDLSKVTGLEYFSKTQLEELKPLYSYLFPEEL